MWIIEWQNIINTFEREIIKKNQSKKTKVNKYLCINNTTSINRWNQVWIFTKEDFSSPKTDMFVFVFHFCKKNLSKETIQSLFQLQMGHRSVSKVFILVQNCTIIIVYLRVDPYKCIRLFVMLSFSVEIMTARTWRKWLSPNYLRPGYISFFV